MKHILVQRKYVAEKCTSKHVNESIPTEERTEYKDIITMTAVWYFIVQIWTKNLPNVGRNIRWLQRHSQGSLQPVVISKALILSC